MPSTEETVKQAVQYQEESFWPAAPVVQGVEDEDEGVISERCGERGIAVSPRSG